MTKNTSTVRKTTLHIKPVAMHYEIWLDRHDGAPENEKVDDLSHFNEAYDVCIGLAKGFTLASPGIRIDIKVEPGRRGKKHLVDRGIAKAALIKL